MTEELCIASVFFSRIYTSNPNYAKRITKEATDRILSVETILAS